MGEAATDARREVDATREELGETIGELRRRGERAGDRLRRALPLVAGGLAAGAGVAVAVVIIRHRRGGPLARAAAERRANPLWRSTAAKALETAATAGVAAVVRQATAAGQARRQREVELSGAAQ